MFLIGHRKGDVLISRPAVRRDDTAGCRQRLTRCPAPKEQEHAHAANAQRQQARAIQQRLATKEVDVEAA
jgi:hypothetical protein